MALALFDPTDVQPGESCSGVIHVCDVCGRRGRWTGQWAWFGSYGDLDAGITLETCGCTQLSNEEAAILLAAKRKRHGRPAKVRRHGFHFW